MGELYALGAALVWAFAVILFKRSGESMSPFALNLFRVGVSLVVLVPLLLVGRQELWRPLPWRDYAVLGASGVLGIAVADTFFHRALFRLGAGLTSIVDCMYSPFIVGFAFLLLGERLSAWQFMGMALVMIAVLLTTRARLPQGLDRRGLLVGIAYGVAAMGTMGLAIVWVKPVLERTPVLWATTVRQILTFALMVPVALVHPRRRRLLGVFKPAANWRFSLPGALLGSCLALLLWIGGMKYTQAGAAAILNQTSTIFILLLATVFLHEPFTRKKLLAALLAFGGIVLVTLG
jgi:drug/metabolite transporter (DMT)-like permease